MSKTMSLGWNFLEQFLNNYRWLGQYSIFVWRKDPPASAGHWTKISFQTNNNSSIGNYFLSPHTPKIPCSRLRTTLGWKLILGWKYIKQSQYTSPVSVKFWNCFIAHVNKSVSDNERWITVQKLVRIVLWIFLI